MSEARRAFGRFAEGPVAVFAGVMGVSLFAGLLIRESQLFRFFKKR